MVVSHVVISVLSVALNSVGQYSTEPQYAPTRPNTILLQYLAISVYPMIPFEP